MGTDTPMTVGTDTPTLAIWVTTITRRRRRRRMITPLTTPATIITTMTPVTNPVKVTNMITMSMVTDMNASVYVPSLLEQPLLTGVSDRMAAGNPMILAIHMTVM